jgi:hypothetical protein
MGVQQKLMRHAHISTTMDKYGNASANRRNEKSLDPAAAPEERNESAGLNSIMKGNCCPVPLIGQFWTVATNAEWPVTV